MHPYIVEWMNMLLMDYRMLTPDWGKMEDGLLISQSLVMECWITMWLFDYLNYGSETSVCNAWVLNCMDYECEMKAYSERLLNFG